MKATGINTETGLVEVVEIKDHPYFIGVQFHPEVTHTDNGKKIFENFIFLICKIKKKMECYFPKKKINSRNKSHCKKR